MNRTTNFNRLNDNGLNEMQIANPAIKQRRIATATQRTQRTTLLRQLAVLAVMLILGGTATGQSVIMNGNYFLTHSEDGTTVSTEATTTFNPATCLWYVDNNRYIQTANSDGEAFSGNNYLQNGSLALGNASQWYQASNGYTLCNRTGGYGNRRYHYPAISSSGWVWTSNQTSNGSDTYLYAVTITPTGANITNPTISGADVLTATGSSSYSASGEAYRAGYTNYYFNSTNHYFDANGNSFTGTPANATIGAATWSLSSNGYATVSNGTVTVNSLPESDIELTLTVTYPVTGGNPAVASGTTLTATKTIILQGTNPSAPTISVSGTTVTMSTDAPGSTTIRYTLDGTDPTTTTGTVYSGSAIDISGQTTSPVIIKAITVRNGNASSVTEQSVQLTLPAPVITADASAGTATITCANAGATIYYTTDGTTPSATNGTEFTDQLSGLPLMTNLQAIAVRDGWNDSPVASAILTLPSGTDGTTVTLFDYEPHSWNYYSDADCPIRSLNPADVKITYYGDGIMMMNDNNYTASSVENTDYITSSGTNYTGGAKVGISDDEDENTFIYYKTLDRGDATETAWTFSSSNQSSAASRCPYTPIPNPFQVRPTYGTTGDARWRGFQCWRLKSVSGGAVYSAASGGDELAVGAVINAETEIYFAPDAETGMDVQFEAVWARAYVTTSNNNDNGLSNAVSYERNFRIITNTANLVPRQNANYQYTLSSVYPNGTSNGTDATTTKGGTTVRGGDVQNDGTNWNTDYNRHFTLSANTKFEYVGFNCNGNNQQNTNRTTISGGGHDLIIGRGCTGTVNIIQGISEAATNTFRFRVESGTYNKLIFMGKSGVTSGYMYATMGSDYDRATNEQNGPDVDEDIVVSDAGTVGENTNIGNEVFHCVVKSGDYDLGSYGGSYQFYLSSPGGATYGKRTLIVEGGLFSDIAGGIEGDPTNIGNHDMVTMRIKGGTIKGATFGAAQFAESGGHRNIIITGGDFQGWIAGGANGTRYTQGGLYGHSNLYFGGDASVVGNNTIMNSAVGGNIFGAGCGFSNNSSSGQVTLGTTVVIADEAHIQRGVYGGGAFGFCSTTQTADIYILGGQIDGISGSVTVGGVNGTGDNATRTGIAYNNDIKGGVFGGANQNKGGTANITMKGGIVNGGIYGGSNYTGTLSGDVTIQIDGGQVGTTSQTASIFGGGYGQTTTVNGNVSVTLGTCTAGDATVYGDVYGGSALGTVNDASSDKTTVSLYNGTIRGGIYGGGYGPGGVAANVNGAVEVKVFGGSVLCSESDPQGEAGSGSVFGCNNAGGAPQSTVKVDIYKTDAAPGEGQYALHAVYGGGNKANYSGTPVVTIHGCNSSIEYVYGGGNASDVRGTNVTIWGGTIGNAFGGGNGYSVTGNHTNQSADHYNPGANITTEGTNLKIYGGTIGAAFGGSNQYGTINDGVQVTVDSREESNTGRPACVDTYTTCPLSIGELYSGGNEAALISSRNPLDYITPNKIIVSLSCSANIGMLFGGAKAADYVGDITLVVDGGTYTKVFGGNNKGGTITGNVTVTFNGGRAEEVYGGCNESGSITGNITVNIDSTNSTCPTRFYVENVYGGGNLAAYGGSPKVNIINGTVQENVYGGGYGSTAEVAGSPAVTVGVSNNEKRALVLGNVFGGGNAAPVSGDTDVKILYNSYIKGNVYGGGNKATVSGDTKVNIGN